MGTIYFQNSDVTFRVDYKFFDRLNYCKKCKNLIMYDELHYHVVCDVNKEHTNCLYILKRGK
jgi:hypothetical protein